MIRLHALLCVVPLLLLLAGCSSSDTSASSDRAPWADATFLDPLPTTITFTNESSEVRNLDVDLRRYRKYINEAVPDSLGPGETATIEVLVHRPRYLFYRSGDHQSHRLLLPGRARHLNHVGETVVETGPFAVEYEYIDRALMPFRPVGRQPVTIKDLNEFRRVSLLAAQNHLDTIIRPEDLPRYIAPLLEGAIAAGTYQDALNLRGYQMFFYADTLPVETSFTDSVSSFLARDSYNETPDYAELYEYLAMFNGEKDTNPAHAIPTNHSNAITLAYLAGYPVSNRRYDAVATYLAKQITDDRVYLGKMENIDTLYATLPPAYQKELDLISQESVAQKASPNGLSDFLRTPLLTSNDEEREPGSLSQKPLRLLKFWFAGCYPCLVQQPHEKDLLASYPEVDLIYVNHSTRKDVWLKYLEKHQPPTTLQLHIRGMKTKSVRSAAGTTGAPTYLMVDAEGQTVCRPCPKPSDPLLREIIDKQLAGK